MSRGRPKVLLDIDGVVLDFVSPVLRLINDRTGGDFVESDVTGWDIYQALGVDKEVARLVDAAIMQPGFCANLEPYEGAVKGLIMLRELADVYPVTAPFAGPNWIGEREVALTALGFDRRDIVFTHNKSLVTGDFIVDDKASTLVSWQIAHPDGVPILMSRPWNAAERAGTPGLAVSTWLGLYNAIEEVTYGV